MLSMGINQQLTTEQLNELIFFNEVYKHIQNMEMEHDAIQKPTVCEMIDSSDWRGNEKELERIKSVAKVLKYYEYIDDTYEPTVDGEQYLLLFEEHLLFVEKEPTVVVNNKFLNINLGDLKLDFTLLKIGSDINVNIPIMELVDRVIKILKKK